VKYSSLSFKATVGFALLVGMVALSACGGGSSGSDGGSVTYSGYGGTFQAAESKAWFGPFQEENPDIKVVEDQPIDLAKLAAMQETGNVTWDVISTSDAQAYDDAETLEKIDCKVVECDGFAKGIEFNGYRMPYYTWSVALTYNTEEVSPPPNGWADFFDTEKYPGKRALWNQATGDTLEAALIADGVKPDDLYPLDVERALAKIDTIKDDVIWFEGGDECRQLVASGEAVMGNCWNDTVAAGKEEGEPIEIAWNQCFLLLGSLGIPKGSQNVENAQKLVAFMTSDENNAAVSNYATNGPVKEASLKDVKPEVAENLATSHSDVCISVDRTSLVEDGAEALKKMQEYQTK